MKIFLLACPFKIVAVLEFVLYILQSCSRLCFSSHAQHSYFNASVVPHYIHRASSSLARIVSRAYIISSGYSYSSIVVLFLRVGVDVSQNAQLTDVHA